MRAWARAMAFDLARMALLTGALTTLFILGDLIVYGRVNW